MRLIDADTLFKFLKGQREKETGAYSKGRNNGINIAIGAIRNEQICPTVDAVPVVYGEWLPTNDENKKRCSRCDVIHLIAQYPAVGANLCPACGARMDGGNEE